MRFCVSCLFVLVPFFVDLFCLRSFGHWLKNAPLVPLCFLQIKRQFLFLFGISSCFTLPNSAISAISGRLTWKGWHNEHEMHMMMMKTCSRFFNVRGILPNTMHHYGLRTGFTHYGPTSHLSMSGLPHSITWGTHPSRFVCKIAWPDARILGSL